MEVLKFNLSGKTAFFKRPDVNTYYYYSYGNIHKVALLGLFGAIMGYGGYNQMAKEDKYPEYYKKLSSLKIAIVPISNNGCFSKKVQVFNNSVGYASQEKGGNLIVKEQWLENPSWDIYINLDNDEAKKLADMIVKHKCVYIPYLGKNDHIADISAIELVNNVEEVEDINKLDCLVLKECIDIDLSGEDEDYEVDNPFKYEESLPCELDDNNMYILKKYVYSNMCILKHNCKVYKVNNNNIVFM